MELWVVFTIAAAAVQTVRFMLQKQLRDVALSTGGATFSRFVFAAPLAIVLTGLSYGWAQAPIPDLPARFWAFACTGGLMQIVATMATVALFSERNFAVGVAFTKTETVLVALFSAVVLAEPVSRLGLIAILIGVAGVILLSRTPGTAAWALWNRASMLGLIAGACFGVSAIGYRGATLALGDSGFFLRAILTLAVATSFQAVIMAVWLRLREPGELSRVARLWRKTALVGVTGMLGSLGWFCAFALQNAAYVRSLGQIELLFSMIVATLVFHQRNTGREALGIAFLAVSIVLIVLVA